MQKARTNYLIIIFLIILAGILSRKLDFIPLFVGDILYAIMIYFIVRFIFLKKRPFIIFTIALLLCFVIELQQLINVEWLVTIRKTQLGHYILGEGFLWSDLAYYTIGGLISLSIDCIIKILKVSF